MKITYVLPEPELGGGNKVIFQHAHLLLKQGHRVTAMARGPKPAWVNFDGEYVNYEARFPPMETQDLVIATFWPTVPLAKELELGPVAHFCQGYEGDWPHLSGVRPQIESVYRHDIPTLVVTPHLADLLYGRFGRESRVVPPPIDPIFRPAFRVKPGRHPWIVVSGVFEAEVKGIRTALEAIRRLREMGQPCRVLRISVLPITEEEKFILVPDRYLYCVEPRAVAEELRRCDLLVFSSLHMEGFGLPVLEAMVSKIPVVASRIPSTEYMGGGKLTLVDSADPAAFASAAKHLLKNIFLWHKARRQGYNAAAKFHPRNVATQLEEQVQWARRRAVERR